MKKITFFISYFIISIILTLTIFPYIFEGEYRNSIFIGAYLAFVIIHIIRNNKA